MSLFRSTCTTLLASSALLTAAPAPAQALPAYEPMCDSNDFPLQPAFHMATVAASSPKLYFLRDGDGCPEKGSSCQTKAYVLAGDHLLIGKQRGEWNCAWYQGTKRPTAGWVRSADLVAQTAAPPQGDWSGHWRAQYGSVIDIARKGNTWQVNGKASWGSGANMHFGDMEGELQVQGARAHLGPTPGPQVYDCIADFTRVGDFLVVHDNNQCGGVNVNFNGVYLRAR